MEKQFITKNGIELFYYPNHNTHSFCLSLYIKAGTLYEEDKNNGITHFLEHILFRNINHLMDGKMYKELDFRGLYFNGATYKEFMQLYIIGSPKHFQAAIDILLKVFSEITLSIEELETEKQRVKAEIREADEYKSLDYFAGKYVWKDTSLTNTITGTVGNLSRFSRKKMETYRKELLTVDNLFFYITGNVSKEDIELAQEKIGNVDVNTHGLTRDNYAVVPKDFCKRNLEINVKNSKDTLVQFSFDFIREKYTYAELTVIYDILFSGENSLIHQELSEKRGMIYSYSSVMEKYNNIGRIYFTYEVKAKDLYYSIEIIKTALDHLTDNLEERLKMVLPEYTDNAYMLYDDNEDFNWSRAYETHIMNERSKSIEETTKKFTFVTAERIKAVAQEIFKPCNLVISIKGDKQKVDRERIRKNYEF